MLQFYYHPLSPLARRVWLALLEKNLDFEPLLVHLDQGEQFKPSFFRLNPFHHVPVLVDGPLTLIESLAILDYLELKYPDISLLPHNPQTFAQVKMAQMVTNSELGSHLIPFLLHELDSIQVAQAQRHLQILCKFLSALLGDRLYFGGHQFTLGDIVAGNGLILISRLGFDLQPFSPLHDYCQRLMEREPWQIAQPSLEQIDSWKQIVRALIHQKMSPAS